MDIRITKEATGNTTNQTLEEAMATSLGEKALEEERVTMLTKNILGNMVEDPTSNLIEIGTAINKVKVTMGNSSTTMMTEAKIEECFNTNMNSSMSEMRDMTQGMTGIATGRRATDCLITNLKNSTLFWIKKISEITLFPLTTLMIPSLIRTKL